MSAPADRGPLSDRSRWSRVSEILDRALDVAPGEVPALLEEACAGDAGLRAAVESLLRADSEAGAFLDRPAAEIAADWLADDDGDDASGPEPGAGETVGPWRIVREIGRGGMGVVHLAERADGAFDQRVALKRIQIGRGGAAARARFEQERRILARLEHPGIARLVDGGTTDTGQPYLAMEYVEGVPITEHRRTRDLDLRATLVLFLQVCRAVEYAHRRLVVHRDLKPGNILVTADGMVKLLDFGIAKLVDPDDASGADTVTLDRRLTLRYAAPEQVRGEPPTTSTDVYALGVVLYELVTGSHPYRGTSERSRDLERAILEQEPQPPSAALAAAGGAGRPDRARPVAQVRGDLDRIVLMALRKEPDRRHPSAEALREDLERFLDGRPVRATRPTLRYRAGRFVRRNRAGVAAAVLVGAALVAGLAGTLGQARVAARERDRALLEARRAREVKDFTLGLFRVSDPGESRGARLSARELLDRGARRVERELAGEPALQAEMLLVLAEVHGSLGEYARAESLATRAVEHARAARDAPRAVLADALNRLGVVRRERGDRAGARAAFGEALVLWRAAGPEHVGDEMRTLGELAAVFRHEDRLDSAEVLYRRVLEVDRARLGEWAREVATDLDNLGVLLIDRQRKDEALPLFRRALEVEMRTLGADHPAVATTLTNLGLALADQGRRVEAESCLVRALEVRRRVLGPGHIDLAHSYGVYANLLRDAGDFDRALPMYEEALRIERRALGDGHDDVGRDLNNLAILYFQRGRYEQALARFGEARAHRRRSLPADDRGCMTMEHNIGVTLRLLGRFAEAETILRDVRTRRAHTLGASHLDVAASDHHLGLLLHLTGRDAEAERRLRAALALRVTAAGDSHAVTAQSAEALASLLRDAGRLRESRTLYERALAIDRRVFAAPSPQSAEALVGLGRLELLEGRARAAEPLLAEAFEVRLRQLGNADPRTAEAGVALGLCRAALGAAAGDSLLTVHLERLRGRPGRPDPLVAQADSRLARTRGTASR